MTESQAIVCPTLFNLFKTYSHFDDPADLEKHLIEIQQQLLKEGNIKYRCIERFKFAYPRIKDRFFYDRILKLGQNLEINEKPYFLDVGCCTGTDLRQLLIDGYPEDCLIGMDIRQCYINIGYNLFKDNPPKCGIQFIEGNLFDINNKHPFCKKFKIIHAGSVFHLFNTEEEVRDCIHKATKFLQPGGLLLGGHVCADRSLQYYRHSTKSWKYYIGIDDFKQLLTSQGFTDIQVETQPRLGEEENEQNDFTAFCVSFCALYKPGHNK